jgi:hypothetical protein
MPYMKLASSLLTAIRNSSSLKVKLDTMCFIEMAKVELKHVEVWWICVKRACDGDRTDLLSAISWPICRSAAVTVQRPRANNVPTNSVMTFFQVDAVNSGSKCARTAIMGLGRDIRNLLVAETSAFVSFYLTIKVLDLLSSHNCTKSRKEETR